MVLRVHTPRDKIAVDEKVVDVRALGDERSAEKAERKPKKGYQITSKGHLGWALMPQAPDVFKMRCLFVGLMDGTLEHVLQERFRHATSVPLGSGDFQS